MHFMRPANGTNIGIVGAGEPLEALVNDHIMDQKVCDTRFDGRLYVGVVSTHIVCFPSCQSRLPKRENVRVFTTVADAMRHGFRPCKRCKPDTLNIAPDTDLAQQVMNIVQHRYHEPLTLHQLADDLKVGPYHLQRLFKREPARRPRSRQVVRKFSW